MRLFEKFLKRIDKKKAELNQQKRLKIQEEIIGILSMRLKIPKENITPDSRFAEDLNADSLDIVELTMELEENFGIEIPDEDVDRLKTVNDVIDYILQREKSL